LFKVVFIFLLLDGPDTFFAQFGSPASTNSLVFNYQKQWNNLIIHENLVTCDFVKVIKFISYDLTVVEKYEVDEIKTIKNA